VNKTAANEHCIIISPLFFLCLLVNIIFSSQFSRSSNRVNVSLMRAHLRTCPAGFYYSSSLGPRPHKSRTHNFAMSQRRLRMVRPCSRTGSNA